MQLVNESFYNYFIEKSKKEFPIKHRFTPLSIASSIHSVTIDLYDNLQKTFA